MFFSLRCVCTWSDQDCKLIQDPAQAGAILRLLHPHNGGGAFGYNLSQSLSGDSMSMSVGTPSNTASAFPMAGTPSNAGTPALSNPIKLVPSISAFKSKTSTPQDQAQAQGQIQVQRGWGPKMPGVSASASAPVIGASSAGAGAYAEQRRFGPGVRFSIRMVGVGGFGHALGVGDGGRHGYI
jgi:hypothetical protein